MPYVRADIHPYYIRDRIGNRRSSLKEILCPAHITAFVGSGGKTSTMLALANELCADGAHVIITTTTHIFPLAEPLPERLRVFGTELPDGRLGMPDNLEQLSLECDYLLIESDGSRGLPVKAPAAHEPVIYHDTELVIAVQGLSAYGKPIADVCHRPEQVCEIIGKSKKQLLLPADGAKLLLSENGLRKGIAKKRYAVVLNQADGETEIADAMEIISYLPDDIPLAVTAYSIDGRYKL